MDDTYRASGVMLDTNLLLLYFIGLFDEKRITTFKRTKKFLLEDFRKVAAIVAFFERIITTPHVLAEVSNLAGQLPEPVDRNFVEFMKGGLLLLDEKYVISSEAMTTFSKLGLTDAGIIHLLESKQYFVFTDDFPLANYFATKGVDALNFEHLRSLEW